MQLPAFNIKIFNFHLLFWIVYCICNSYLWYTFDKTYNHTTFYGLTRLPVKFIAVYINFYLLMQFFFKKKYVLFFCLLAVTLIIAGALQTYLSGGGVFDYREFTQYSLPVYSVVILSIVPISVHQFFVKSNESKMMEIEKIKSELSFLKTQIQPHLLFNTLNNIYSLTLNNSQLAGRSILQLSGLLRYILYESEADKVELQKEIDLLRDYIELEKIRFLSRMEISFNISGSVEDKKIPPMLLMPFVENAFKHASNKLEEKIWITIDLIIKQNDLFFTVENSVFDEGKSMNRGHSGIGLENVKRRLSLLYKNYILESKLKENYYHTFLMLSFN